MNPFVPRSPILITHHPPSPSFSTMVDVDISCFPLGFRFAPSDEDLLSFYLWRKVTDQRIPPELEAAIPVLDLYGPQGKSPWLLHPAASSSVFSHSLPHCVAPRDATEWFYCFTRTTRRGSGSCRTTEAGAWVTSGGNKKVKGDGGETLGYKNTLAFKTAEVAGKGAEGSRGNWVMHEFKLEHDGRKAVISEQLVLCRIRCTTLMVGRGVEELVLLEEVRRQQKRQRMCTPTPACPQITAGFYELDPPIIAEFYEYELEPPITAGFYELEPPITAGFYELEPLRSPAQFIDHGEGADLIPANSQELYASSIFDIDHVGLVPLATVESSCFSFV